MAAEIPKVVTETLATPLITFTPTGELVATDPRELAGYFGTCCKECGTMALRAAAELVDFAATPARNMSRGEALQVLSSRVLHAA